MAGMLPGVECARRRRFHQSGGGLSGWPNYDSPTAYNHNQMSTRRPSFCLYATNLESNLTSISSMQRSTPNRAYCNEKLADAAREAKERLDERLRVQWKSEPRRASSSAQPGSRNLQNRAIEKREMHSTEVFGGPKKKKQQSRPKRFSWAKFSGKSNAAVNDDDDDDEHLEECAVCLDQFKEGENLMQLPCVHRFHSRCLLPWLEKNPHCPCCRTEF